MLIVDLITVCLSMTSLPPFKVLYVCDMDHLVEEADLWSAFAAWSQSIVSIRLIKDMTRLMGTSHAYVNFSNEKDALLAYESVQPLFLNSSYCRVSPYDGKVLQHTSRIDRNNGCGLFIKHLDPHVGPSVLWGYFMEFGTIVGCRVAIDDFGISRRFAYVTYEHPEEANEALSAMNGQLIGSQRISVSHNVPKSQRVSRMSIKVVHSKPSENEATASGDGEKATEEESSHSEEFPLTEGQIHHALDTYGPILSLNMPGSRDNTNDQNTAVVIFYANARPEKAIENVKEIAGIPVHLAMLSGTQKYDSADKKTKLSNTTGPVRNFMTPRIIPSVPIASPAAAAAALSGLTIQSPEFTGSSRDDSAAASGNNIIGATDAPRQRGNNLFVRPLYDNVDEHGLREEFGKYGKIIEAKVMYNEHGTSRGYGFVKFETPEEATVATNELNGKELWGNALCIAPAQSKNRRTSKMPAGRQNMMFPQLMPGAAPYFDPSFYDPSAFDQSEYPIHPQMYVPPGSVPGMGMYYLPMDYTYDYYSSQFMNGSPLSYGAMMQAPAPYNPSPPTSSAPTRGTPKTNTPPNDDQEDDTERLGKELMKRVEKHPDVDGQKELASVLTGLLLQQKHSDIQEWLKDDKTLIKRISQAYSAYKDYIASKN